MTARYRDRKSFYKWTIPLATSAVIDQGEEVAVLIGTRTGARASGATDEKALGTAIESVNQTTGDLSVQVELHQRVDLEYFTNDTGTPIVLATGFLGKCWFKDGQTVSGADTNGSGLNRAFAGIVYDVDARLGVGVKRVSTELAELLS